MSKNMSEEAMREDLERIQLQMNATTDESLESTRRMVMLCEESQDVGVKTLTMLDAQGEQLDRIEEGMSQINQDMKDAEKNLEGLEKCCGICVLPWKRTKNYENSSEYANAWKSNEDGKVNSDGPRVVVTDQSQVASGGFVTRITHDAREDEMEGNLGEVSGMLGNLRNMAVDMSNELDSQNKQVDRINTQAQVLDDRVKVANQRANKILKE